MTTSPEQPNLGLLFAQALGFPVDELPTHPAGQPAADPGAEFATFLQRQLGWLPPDQPATAEPVRTGVPEIDDLPDHEAAAEYRRLVAAMTQGEPDLDPGNPEVDPEVAAALDGQHSPDGQQ